MTGNSLLYLQSHPSSPSSPPPQLPTIMLTSIILKDVVQMPPFLKKKNSDPLSRIKPPLYTRCFFVSAHYLFHFTLHYNQSIVVPAIVIFINKLTHQCLLSLRTGIMSDFLEYPPTSLSCFILSLNEHLVNISWNKLFVSKIILFCWY